MPTEDAAIRARSPGASLLWLESPSNPALDVVDIAALAAAAHEAGALVAVDNTLATPLRQRPLELGADFAVASATKQLSGHSDLLLGYVATREPGPPGRAARLAHRDRGDPRPVRDLARAPLARDAGASASTARRRRRPRSRAMLRRAGRRRATSAGRGSAA